MEEFVEVSDESWTVKRKVFHVLSIDGADLPADTAQNKTQTGATGRRTYKREAVIYSQLGKVFTEGVLQQSVWSTVIMPLTLLIPQDSVWSSTEQIMSIHMNVCVRVFVCACVRACDHEYSSALETKPEVIYYYHRAVRISCYM